MGMGGQHHTPAALPPEKRPGTLCTGGPELVWTSVENLSLTRIRSPDCPSRSESLYQVRYPGSQIKTGLFSPPS